MPAKDIYHDTVKRALIKDGWTITRDALVLRWGGQEVFVDLGAECLLVAKKGRQEIAVEVKSFVGKSKIDDLEKALGQYMLYHIILEERKSDRVLYLAVHEQAFRDIFEEAIGELVLKRSVLG